MINFTSSPILQAEFYGEIPKEHVNFPDDSTTIVYAVNNNYCKIDQFISTQAAMENILETVK